MNKPTKPTANRDSGRLDLNHSDSINPDSVDLKSIKLIDSPDWDEVSGEVTFDDRGNAVWQWQAKDHQAGQSFKEERDDSILKHIDIEDLRIIETSDLKHTGTLSGKLELGQRFKDSSHHQPTKGLFSWLQKETDTGANPSRQTRTVTAKPAQPALDMESLSLDSPTLDPLVRDFVNKHMAGSSAPNSLKRREPAIRPHDPLPVLTSPISREQLTRKVLPVAPTASVNGNINQVNRAATSPAKPSVSKTEPAASSHATSSSAPTLAAMLERMGRR